MRPNLSPADESIRFLANHPRGAACVKAHLDFTIAAKRSGGFLGAGEKDVAVPFRSVQSRQRWRLFRMRASSGLRHCMPTRTAIRRP